MTRTVIVGGPFTGKSTMSLYLRALEDAPVFCGDPRSKVREAHPGVTYLPEGLPWGGPGGAAHYVAQEWLPRPGPWIIEGHVMARALALYMEEDRPAPCDRIIVLTKQYALHPGFRAVHEDMYNRVMSKWLEIAHCFDGIVEVR